MKKFTITDQYQNWRLDKFLTEKLGETRSQIQKKIKTGQFLVNDGVPSVHQFLEIGDVIKFKQNNPKAAKTLGQKIISKISKSGNKSVISSPIILIKEKEYLVIEKPAGLLVHSGQDRSEPTLVDWLIKKFPKIKKVGDAVALERNENLFRPGIVHRLDRKVSGLMIIALTQSAFDYLKSQFKLKNVRKEYLALVSGVIPKDDGEINFPIHRSQAGKLVALALNSDKGQAAHTEFEVLQRFRNHTLVQLKPLTGRTNQLRIHLSAYNHPIVGDDVYASRKFQIREKIKLNRIFLHAAHLFFIDPDGKQVDITSPLPEELNEILKKLK
jgi:23S rRNA pseudouridine1911/1915/1917 synthase